MEGTRAVPEQVPLVGGGPDWPPPTPVGTLTG